MGRPEAADFLVVAARQVHRPLQRMRLEHRHGGQHAGEEPLHVGGAAAVEPAVAAGELKRIAGPRLAVDRHHVGVAVEHHAAVDGGSDPGMQVGAGAGVVEAQVGFDVRRRQIVANIGDEIEVGLAGQALEGDEAVENLHRRVDSVFHVDEHSLAGAS